MGTRTTAPALRRPAVAGIAAVTAAVALAACGHSGAKGPSYPAASPPTVPLAVAGQLAHPIKIGLVVTSSSAPGQGGEDVGLAAGARVAEYQLGLAKAGAVTLDVQDDFGTSAGSVTAVKALLADGVVGIVYASEGSHLDQGVAAAQQAHTPVLLPYATDAPPGDGVWLTGPSTSQAVDVLSSVLSSRQLTTPLVLSTEQVGGLSTIASGATADELTESATLGAQVSTAAAKVGTTGGPDAVVVWGSATAEADAVAALQQAGTTVPVLLGPSALSPAFPAQLTALGRQGAATTAGQYITAGVAATDNATTAATATVLQAIRLAASDASVKALLSGKTFSQDGAATADSRSHDAVLALVAAVQAAKSSTPQAVLTALSELTTSPSLGIVGPPLDFASQDALGSESVVGLQATAAAVGQRTGISQQLPALTWFALGPPTGQSGS